MRFRLSAKWALAGSAAIAFAMWSAASNAKSAAIVEPGMRYSNPALLVRKSPSAAARLSESDRNQLSNAASACRASDARGFLTAFASSSAVRRKYSAPVIKYSVTQTVPTYRVLMQDRIPAARYSAFPIQMEDYYYKSAHPIRPGDRGEYIEFELNQSQNDQISVEWTRVHYDGNSDGGDDLGNAFTLDGKPYKAGGMNSDGQLLFYPTADCWQLVEDIRNQRGGN